MTRNILEACPKAEQPALKRRLRSLWTAPTPDIARTGLTAVLQEFADRAPKALTVLESGFDAATAILAFPEVWRVRLRTTNMIERANREIRRRERVVSIFPNPEAVTRLIGAVLQEMDEGWATGPRYIDTRGYERTESGKTTQAG